MDKKPYYAVFHVPTAQFCEVEGRVCYDSYASVEKAQASIDDMGERAGNYEVRPLPPHLIPCMEALVERGEYPADDETLTSWKKFVAAWEAANPVPANYVSAQPYADKTDHTPAPKKTIALVSCVKTKQQQPAAAKDLYISPWFKGARQYVENHADSWHILSAEHGLLDPETVTAPYDTTLYFMKRAERGAWAQRVLEQLAPHIQPGDHIIVLAGELYREFLLSHLLLRGCTVEVPMRGLEIGEQLAFLKEANGGGNPLPAPSLYGFAQAALF